jgi:trans-2,3-dihydro-3-hydroxyanthranilate isomerase
MTQPRPDFTRVEEEADDVLSALGLSSADVIFRSTAGGTTHVLVATSQPIEELDPDPGRVTQASLSCGAHTLVPFRALDESTLHARVFASAVGVTEDPGSGSAAGPIGLIARQIWSTRADVTITMGAEIGRPCRLEVHAAEDVRVGGSIVLGAEGHFLATGSVPR